MSCVDNEILRWYVIYVGKLRDVVRSGEFVIMLVIYLVVLFFYGPIFCGSLSNKFQGFFQFGL